MKKVLSVGSALENHQVFAEFPVLDDKRRSRVNGLSKDDNVDFATRLFQSVGNCPTSNTAGDGKECTSNGDSHAAGSDNNGNTVAKKKWDLGKSWGSEDDTTAEKIWDLGKSWGFESFAESWCE
jgi:hypothetical protein